MVVVTIDGHADPVMRSGAMSGFDRWLRLAVLILCAGVLAVGGCSNKKTSDKSLSFVTADDAHSLLGGKREALFGLGGEKTSAFVDPRTLLDYRKGHIPGAIHLPYENVREQTRRLQPYTTIIVYGDSYNSTIAQAMSKTLIELGFDDVRTLRGGLRAWQDAGFDLAKGIPSEEE
jgi:rhodanese-related sulfurtransferase